jgi:hypothetical protein
MPFIDLRIFTSSHVPSHCRFITEFHTDMNALNCLSPTDEPKATDFIPHMISMIEQIIDNGNAYVAEGNVWFSVESIGDYGALSGRSLVSKHLILLSNGLITIPAHLRGACISDVLVHSRVHMHAGGQ